MRALLCAATVLSTVAPCFPKTPEPSYPVTIIYHFDGDPSAVAFGEMRDEVRLLLQSSSITPEWRDRRLVHSRDSFQNLVVVSFHGRCDARAGAPSGGSGAVLGRSQVTDGEVQPFIDIECGQVEASLHAGASAANLNANAALGRALARVLAHELYHVLARTTSHAKTGIAKPALSDKDLLSSGVGFTRSDADHMRPAQTHPGGLPAGGASTASIVLPEPPPLAR